MQPSLVHHCPVCSSSTSIPFSASVFSQNNSCPHCGTISTGINVQSKQEEEASMHQEELSRLFSAHMSLTQPPPASQAQQQVAPAPPTQEQTHAVQPITYVSQHYTHSYHIAPVQNVQQTSAKTHIELSQLESIFLRNSIDPSLLFPSQIDLFQNADDDQRLRLLELWRISPPQGHPNGGDYNTSRQLYDWPPSSLAQEEAMAKLRYERLEAERVQQEEIKKHQQELDQSMDQEAESAAVNATRDILAASPPSSAEPYILSGYDMLAKRDYEESAQAAVHHLKESTRYNQATDPVYNHAGSNGGLWEKNVGSMLDMENQYGAFAHARDYDTRPVYADEEMVM